MLKCIRYWTIIYTFLRTAIDMIIWSIKVSDIRYWHSVPWSTLHCLSIMTALNIEVSCRTLICIFSHIWSVQLNDLELSVEKVNPINFKIIFPPCAISLCMTMGWTNDHLTCIQLSWCFLAVQNSSIGDLVPCSLACLVWHH